MKKSSVKILTGIIITALAGGIAPNADAGNSRKLIKEKREAVKSVRPFRGVKHVATSEPATEYENLRSFDYLEGPDGSTWFYTSEFDIERIDYSEWWSEEYIKGYTFTIYNSEFKKIGEIKDKVRLREGETRAVSVSLDPAVSRNFFNTDDNPEIMVFVAMNTESFTNKYYNIVYSLGGTRDEEGNDLSLMNIEGRCVDAFNTASKGEKEKFYFSFVGEEVSEDLNADYATYVDFLNSYIQPVTIYAPAEGEEGPVEVFSKNIYLTRLPGDSTDGIYYISKPVGGTPYIIFSYYEKPLFIDPTGMAEDDTQTPDNSLIIEVYKIDGKEHTLTSTTQIPLNQAVSPDQLMYTFYSIGSVAWKHDVDMVVNGTQDEPAFIVARDVVAAANLDDMESGYAIYDNKGNVIKPLAQGTESIILFDSDTNGDPEVMFVAKKDGAYNFTVGSLYSGEPRFTLAQDNDGDPISASCNRVKDLDGKYKYAFEMTYYDIDDEGNNYTRVAWFDDKGELDRIDRINVGKDVMAAMVNMYSESLNPHLYDDDDNMEYAVLVKRTHGNSTRNEFMVVDHDGRAYANFSEDDGKGDPYLFTVLPGDVNRIMMVYTGNKGYNVNIFELPFDEIKEDTGFVGSIENEGPEFTFDGSEINAPGCTIKVYDQLGALVAQGNGSVTLAQVSKGVYVIVVTDGNGNKTTKKILK